jgi:hypothetical protein
LRIESIYPNRGFNKTQFYASCAQVEIVGSKGGDGLQPGPTVKFPGAFDNYDEGVWLREEYFNKWLSYKLPGPTVWRG